MMGGSDIKAGDVFTQVVVENLTRTQIVQYAGASGDYNPLHSDEVYATQAAGYRGVFAHGMLTMGLTGKAVTQFIGASGLAKFGVRFVEQVWPGDTLFATVTVTDVREDEGRRLAYLSIVTTNQEGVAVMTGTATVIL
jgi:acyl dehydratase